MKITKRQLRRIIREEKRKLVNEQGPDHGGGFVQSPLNAFRQQAANIIIPIMAKYQDKGGAIPIKELEDKIFEVLMGYQIPELEITTFLSEKGYNA